MAQLPLSSLRNWESLGSLNHIEHLNHESRDSNKRCRAPSEETVQGKPIINKTLASLSLL